MKFSGLIDVWVMEGLHSFCDRPRDIATATNFVAQFAKLDDPTLIGHDVGVPKWGAIPVSEWAC